MFLVFALEIYREGKLVYIHFFATFTKRQFFASSCFSLDDVKKVTHSLIAVGAVGVRLPLYFGHS